MLLALIALAACDQPQSSYQRELYTFGTEVRIELRGLDAAAAATVADDVERALNRWNRDWYAWGDGELGQLNASLATQTEVVISEDLAQRIGAALAMRELSGGLFDPTIGALVSLWQFDGRAATDASVPSATSLAAATARANVAVRVSGDIATLTTDQRGLVIDFGGIAKGFALQALRDTLREQAVPIAIIDIGGDVLAIDRAGTARLRVGIQNPSRGDAIAFVESRDGEVTVTSGDYARYRETDEGRAHHLIDPRTGEPGRLARSVTVIGSDPPLADAAATALMIAGPALFHETCARMGVDYALMIDSAGNPLTTAALRPRLHWLGVPGADGRE